MPIRRCLWFLSSGVQQLFRRYNNVPASLADASLIRLSELIDPCKLLTLDSDFTVYRRKLIPLSCLQKATEYRGCPAAHEQSAL